MIIIKYYLHDSNIVQEIQPCDIGSIIFQVHTRVAMSEVCGGRRRVLWLWRSLTACSTILPESDSTRGSDRVVLRLIFFFFRCRSGWPSCILDNFYSYSTWIFFYCIFWKWWEFLQWYFSEVFLFLQQPSPYDLKESRTSWSALQPSSAPACYPYDPSGLASCGPYADR